MYTKLPLLLLLLLAVSCSDTGLLPNNEGPDPLLRNFNFSFRYGVGALNEINTFKDTYTKDLIQDGTVTVPFVLTQADFDSIKSKMLQIDFFNYPDTFVVAHNKSSGFITPHDTFHFNIQNDSAPKTLFWEDNIIADDTKRTKLRELILLIRAIVESKPEYKQLPPSRGGYL